MRSIMATPSSAPAQPPPAATARTIGDELLRATWFFQAGCALPTLFVLGVMAFVELFEPRISLYDFITDLSNALFAAAIIFLVIVQRRIPLSFLDQLRFEAGKAFFASAMWLWLFLDALLAHKERDRGNPYYEDERRRRVTRAAIASVLLWILFYPPLAYAGWVWRERTRYQVGDGEGNEEGEARVGEDTPLLREGS